jgi:hypothetical protein
MRRAICAAFCALAVSVDAAPPQEKPRIAVISVAADLLTYYHVGPRSPSNPPGPHHISGWDLDAEYARRMAQAVRDFLGADAVVPEIDPETFSELDKPKLDAGGTLSLQPNWQSVESALKRIALEQRARYILVLTHGQTSDYIGRSRQKLTGLGVYSNYKTRVAFAHLMLNVIHPETGRPLISGLIQNPNHIRPSAPGAFPGFNILSRDLPLPLADRPFSEHALDPRHELRNALADLLDPETAKEAVRYFLARPPDDPR